MERFARGSWRERGELIACGLVFGVLSALAFSPFAVWWLGLLAPACLLLASDRLAAGVGVDGVGRRGLASGAAWVALGTLPFWAFEQRWIAGVSAAGFVPLLLILSGYTWLAVWACARVLRWCGSRRAVGLVVLGPIVWGGVEFFRGRVAFDGYPWYLAGMPMIESVFLASAGAVVGVYGAGVLVAGVSAGVVCIARGARMIGAIGAGAWALVWVLLSLVGGGQLERASAPSGDPVRFGVVQTNVPQSTRMTWTPLERLRDASRFLDLSAEGLDAGAQVLVWPETMFPGETLEASAAMADEAANLGWSLEMRGAEAVRALRDYGWLDGIELRAHAETGVVIVPSGLVRRVVLAGQRELGVPIVMGAAGFEGYRVETSDGSLRPVWASRFNSAFVVEGGLVQGGRYDKLHLTPFGETMPYIRAVPWLESALLTIGLGARGMAFDLDAGDRAERLVVSPSGGGEAVTIATPICFEATMPHVVRRLAAERGERAAGVIVQMTNDGWFGSASGGRTQHLDAVRWRAVETGTPIVRSANTGVSAFVDARGRVRGRLPEREAGVLVMEVAAAGGPVPMAARLGDALGWLTLGVAGVLVGLAVVRGRAASTDAGAGLQN